MKLWGIVAKVNMKPKRSPMKAKVLLRGPYTVAFIHLQNTN